MKNCTTAPLWREKLFRIMKLTSFLLFCVIMQVAANSYSQKARLQINMKNAEVKDVLEEIKKQSEFDFLYKSDLIKSLPKVTVEAREVNVTEILDQIIPDDLEYEIFDRNIIIRKNPHPVVKPVEIEEDDVDITGKITDENGEGLPGASVIEKGTSNGTTTDLDGNFKLGLDEAATLVVSFVGYKTTEVAIAGRSTVDVQMEVDAEQLEEIVVIGYGGVVNKKDLTGAADRANLDRALETSNVSIMQALQGALPGVNVGAVSIAGENPSISIRGRNNLSGEGSGDNAPLIVVDGIIYRGSLIDLNPADIKSIDILKDASSASIYGSQASNGVIVVETKNGAGEVKPVISFNSSISFQSPTNSMRPMRDAELREFYKDVYWDLGSKLAPDYVQDDPSFDFAPNLKTSFLVEGYRENRDIDWWNHLTRDASIQTHNLSVRGRSENTGYFVSAGITDQKGFNVNDDYTRYNFRVNLDTDINDWLKVGTQTYMVISDYSGVSMDARQTFRYHPWAPVTDDNGEFVTNPIDGLNPFLTLQQDDSDIRLNLSSTLFAEVQLPVEGLKYRVNYSNSYRTTNRNNFNPHGNNFTGIGSKSNSINWDYTFDNIVSYNRSFNDSHNIAATLLYGVEKRHLSSTFASARNFGVDVLGYERLQAGDPEQNVISTTREEESSLYQMARVLYNYDHKYFFTGTVRRDGFSGFGENDKIAIFPSVALAWAISEESFAKEVSWLSYLKARVSYGQIGRRGVDRYQTQARVNAAPSVPFGDGGTVFQGQAIAALPNSALGWETTTGFDGALEFEVLNSKLRGTIEYYNNKTENVLYRVQLPEISGFKDIWSNIAEVGNNGIELSIEGEVMRNENFVWTAGINFNRVRNKIRSILGPINDQDGDGKEDDLIAGASNSLFIGQPVGTIYNYEIIGMWQLNDADVPSGFLPGTYKLADLNNDNEISSLNDRKILGYQDPSYRFGISNNLTYKNFNLNIFINSIQGGDKYYLGNNDDAIHWTNDQLANNNVPSGGWDYWTPANPNAKYRRLDTSSAFGRQPSNSDGARPYNQRSFVRIQDVTLSYTLSSDLIDKIGISKAKVFFSGKNLATWTEWNGWDPETGTGFGTGDAFGAFFAPTMKSYTLGLNVEF